MIDLAPYQIKRSKKEGTMWLENTHTGAIRIIDTYTKPFAKYLRAKRAQFNTEYAMKTLGI